MADVQCGYERGVGILAGGNSQLGSDRRTRIGASDGQEKACRERLRHPGEETELVADEKTSQDQLSGCDLAGKQKKGQRASGGGAAYVEDGLQDQLDPSPRSRRVGIVCAPPNYKRPHSLLDLKNAAAAASASGSTDASRRTSSGSCSNIASNCPPVVPPRSPLRPTPPRHRHLQVTPTPSGPSQIEQDTASQTTIEHSEPNLSQMPIIQTHSLGSLTALLETLNAGADPTLLPDKELPLPPDYEQENSYNDEEDEEDLNADTDRTSSSDSLTLDLGITLSPGISDPVPANQPTTMTKRMHALQELLTSERAYASDLALIRDIHIPLALGQPAPFHPNGTPSPPPFSPGSGSSSRTVSTASDSSTASSQLGPPMSRDDVRIIFGNISDLAVFSDKFVERLEGALGGALEGGVGEDRVGALFLEIIPALEPPYKTYITRHPTALAHLNALPSSPALSAYLSHTRTLASSLTHAWDLPSLLIKPVQRLLKYSLLLGAIIDATPDSHGDRVALIKAREKMEEVARSVNEDRRRWEVVREVLGGAPLPNTNGTNKSKKGSSVNVGVSGTASAHLSRMKSLRAPKLRDFADSGPDSVEAAEVARLEKELQRYAAFLDKLAKDARDWKNATHVALVSLRQWGITFGAVLGLTPSPSALNPDLLPDSPSQQAIDTADPEVRSEAYDAFTLLLSTLPRFSKTLESNLENTFIPVLCDMKAMLEPPMKLFSAMHALAPLHNALLHTPFSASKSKRPAPTLLTASQSYLALRSALLAELPTLFGAMNRATGYAVRMLAREQATFYWAVSERWADLWDALRVEGERCGGSDETLRVWWERWSAVEDRLSVMKIAKKDKWWAERERELRESRGDRDRDRDREKDGGREREGRDKPGRRATAPPSGPSTPAANVVATLAALDPAHAPLTQASPPSKRQHHQAHQAHASNDTIGSSRRRSGSTSTTSVPTQIHRRSSDESLRSGKSGKYSMNGGKSSRNSRGEDEPPVPRLKPNFSFPNGNSGPQRVKSTPAISPLRTSASTSSSQVFVDLETAYPSSPLSYATFDDEERDRDGRGRTQRRSSFKSKLADSFRPAHHRRRSSSVKSLGAPSAAPSYHSTDVPLPPYSPSSAHFLQSHTSHPSTSSAQPQNARPRPSSTLATTRALYTTRVIHACLPPPGVSYRGLLFFTLEHGETFDVLREYGHPSTHADLPLYVDDGEDCLLLVRARGKGGGQGIQEGDVGWALASFLLPLD